MPITVKMAMKPIPTLIKSLRSVDIMTKENKDAHKERTDSCAVPEQHMNQFFLYEHPYSL